MCRLCYSGWKVREIKVCVDIIYNITIILFILFSFYLITSADITNFSPKLLFTRYFQTVSNGPKEQLGAGEGANSSEEFEPWRTQQQNSAAHTAYGTSVPISTATDLYSMNTPGNIHQKLIHTPVLQRTNSLQVITVQAELIHTKHTE